MWEPEPGWQRLRSGSGAATYGTWLATRNGRPIVVKRLSRPVPGDPAELADPASFAWWRREAEVATTGVVDTTTGLRAPAPLGVEDDDEGVTVFLERVDDARSPGLFLARSLGRFARNPVPAAGWLAGGQLRERLARVERRGGWRTLERTTLADVAAHLWARRAAQLAVLDDLPQVLQHGDPTHDNLLGRSGDEVVAIDWSQLGTGPVGHDLGLFALASRESFDTLLDAYADGWDGPRSQAEAGARVACVYTVLSRLDWALKQVADGEGALAGKYRHPSVAPYVLSMQRQADQIEALLQA